MKNLKSMLSREQCKYVVLMDDGSAEVNLIVPKNISSGNKHITMKLSTSLCTARSVRQSLAIWKAMGITIELPSKTH